MSKYRFRLEALQKIRQIERNQQRARLADAYRANEVLEERKVAIADELVELRQIQRAAVGETNLNIAHLAAAGMYEPVLRAEETNLTNQQKMIDEEIEKRRQALLEADRGVRVLELLDDKRRNEHRREKLRLETKELDEVAVRSAWNKRS